MHFRSLEIFIFDLEDYEINNQRCLLRKEKGRIRRDEIDNVFLFLNEENFYTVKSGVTYKKPKIKAIKLLHNGKVFWMDETYIERV